MPSVLLPLPLPLLEDQASGSSPNCGGLESASIDSPCWGTHHSLVSCLLPVVGGSIMTSEKLDRAAWGCYSIRPFGGTVASGCLRLLQSQWQLWLAPAPLSQMWVEESPQLSSGELHKPRTFQKSIILTLHTQTGRRKANKRRYGGES